ncbi:TPA: hypothetical protein ACJKLK_001213 [Acinetobacter baumannii]
MTTFKEAQNKRKFVSIFPEFTTKAMSYEDFVGSLDFVNGRAELSGHVSTIGAGNNHTIVFSKASIADQQAHIQRMKDEGYIVQRLDVSKNFFIIAESTFIYKPEFKRKAYWDAHPNRLAALWLLAGFIALCLIMWLLVWICSL